MGSGGEVLASAGVVTAGLHVVQTDGCNKLAASLQGCQKTPSWQVVVLRDEVAKRIEGLMRQLSGDGYRISGRDSKARLR